MKEGNFVGIINSGVIRIAIRQIIKIYSPAESIQYTSTFSDYEDITNPIKYLLLESQQIPEPMSLSLAKINSSHPGIRILVLENKPCKDDLSPFISDKVKLSADEVTFTDRIKNFLDVDDSKNNDTIISDREKEIVKLVALGKTNKEISDSLFISPHTVVTHRKNITAKLGIKTIAGLTLYAVLNNIIRPDQVSD